MNPLFSKREREESVSSAHVFFTVSMMYMFFFSVFRSRLYIVKISKFVDVLVHELESEEEEVFLSCLAREDDTLPCGAVLREEYGLAS